MGIEKKDHTTQLSRTHHISRAIYLKLMLVQSFFHDEFPYNYILI